MRRKLLRVARKKLKAVRKKLKAVGKVNVVFVNAVEKEKRDWKRC